MAKREAERVCGNCDHVAQSAWEKRNGRIQAECRKRPLRRHPSWTHVTFEPINIGCKDYSPIGGRVRPTRARGKGKGVAK